MNSNWPSTSYFARRVTLASLVVLSVFLTWVQVSNVMRYTPLELTVSQSIAFPLTIPGLLAEGFLISYSAGETSRAWVHPTVAIVFASLFWSGIIFVIASAWNHVNNKLRRST